MIAVKRMVVIGPDDRYVAWLQSTDWTTLTAINRTNDNRINDRSVVGAHRHCDETSIRRKARIRTCALRGHRAWLASCEVLDVKTPTVIRLLAEKDNAAFVREPLAETVQLRLAVAVEVMEVISYCACAEVKASTFNSGSRCSRKIFCSL